jgi:DMSO/TMAO reductase YedYZ molybdopterin-dependent catalytic subunit
MISSIISRRTLITGIGLGASGLLLPGCDALNSNATFRRVLTESEKLTLNTHRLITDRAALAQEFSAMDISPKFTANGSINPGTAMYNNMVKTGFAEWRLKIDGLVGRPLSISLPQLQQMPVREQITRHDCVEGWSAIGKWAGPQLRMLLEAAKLSTRARYIVFHCADDFDGKPYYESIDLIDAFHPQTILAWRMNDATLPVAHGAPLRLRVERQLGYKHAKYLMRIEARDRIDNLYAGKGGYWEDNVDYAWYAGI